MTKVAQGSPLSLIFSRSPSARGSICWRSALTPGVPERATERGLATAPERRVDAALRRHQGKGSITPRWLSSTPEAGRPVPALTCDAAGRRRPQRRPWLVSAPGRPVLLDEVCWNAATAADVDAMLMGPEPHGLGVDIVLASCAATAGTSPSASRCTHPAGRCGVLLQGLA